MSASASGFRERVTIDPEATLWAFADAAIASGYRIGNRRFGVQIIDGHYRAARGGLLCPIGAVLLNQRTTRKVVTAQGAFDDASRILTVDPAWIDVFLDGYDDTDDPCGVYDEAWEIGMDFRCRFINSLPSYN